MKVAHKFCPILSTNLFKFRVEPKLLTSFSRTLYVFATIFFNIILSFKKPHSWHKTKRSTTSRVASAQSYLALYISKLGSSLGSIIVASYREREGRRACWLVWTLLLKLQLCFGSLGVTVTDIASILLFSLLHSLATLIYGLYAP